VRRIAWWSRFARSEPSVHLLSSREYAVERRVVQLLEVELRQEVGRAKLQACGQGLARCSAITLAQRANGLLPLRGQRELLRARPRARNASGSNTRIGAFRPTTPMRPTSRPTISSPTMAQAVSLARQRVPNDLLAPSSRERGSRCHRSPCSRSVRPSPCCRRSPCPCGCRCVS
jgi:hypothetical protein